MFRKTLVRRPKQRPKRINFVALFSILLLECFLITFKDYFFNFIPDYSSDLFFRNPSFLNKVLNFSGVKRDTIPDFCVLVARYYNFTNTTLFPPKIYYENSTFHRFPKPIYDATPWITYSVYFELKDIFVSFHGRIVFSDLSWFSRKKNFFRQFPPLNVTGEYDSAIYFANEHIFMFAHDFLDVFSPLALIPREIVESYPLLVPDNYNVIKQLYEILGFNSSNLILMPKDKTYLLVHKLITVQNTWPENSHPGFPFYSLSKKLRKAIPLDNIKPYRYILENRQKTNWRYIKNFDDVVEQVKKHYPSITWDLYTKTNFNISEAAKFWNSCLLMYGPPGSNNANCIFMQQNTCMCVQFCLDVFDLNALKQIQTMGVICVLSRADVGSHYNGPTTASIQGVINSIQMGLDLMKKYQNIEISNETLEKADHWYPCTELTTDICNLKQTDY